MHRMQIRGEGRGGGGRGEGDHRGAASREGWENMSKCTLCKSGGSFIMVGLGKHVKVYTV